MAAARTPQAEARRYTRIFGRDAGISALGMAACGDALLLDGARQGLQTLAAHQAENGQIPKYADPDKADSDFWYVGCIDATLWWLIAVSFISTQLQDEAFAELLGANLNRAITWLRCQEHPRLFLLRQDEASDWADIMPRSGFVLYSNALWYYVKRLYGLPYQDETRYHFNHLFYPFTDHVPEYRRLRLLQDYVREKARNRALYLSFVNFSYWGEEGDVLGNLLSILVGLSDDTHTDRILRALAEAGVDAPYPARATCMPIARDDRLWRTYMARHDQNFEHQYHNGGAWPFIGGFRVLALATLGRHEQAAEALLRLAEANAVGGWAFSEWFHGQTGAPGGMAGQSWNAAMFILACHAMENTGIFRR